METFISSGALTSFFLDFVFVFNSTTNFTNKINFLYIKLRSIIVFLGSNYKSFIFQNICSASFYGQHIVFLCEKVLLVLWL